MIIRPAAVLLAAGMCLTVGACATTKDTTPASVRAAAEIETPRRRLEALSEIEALSAVAITPRHRDAARTIDPRLPPVLTPGSAEYRRATRPLDEILTEFAVERPVSAIEEPSAEHRAEAAGLYVRARQAYLSGNAETAAGFMEQAVRLDPGAPRLWQQLGEARLSAGDRPGGVDALTMAAELGSEDPRVSLTLASDAASRSEGEGVIRWAGAAWTRSQTADAPERTVAGAMLGSALLERGDLLAGAQALGEAIGAVDRRAPQPGDPVELVRLRARRAEIGYRLGDAWFALGQPARAADAYDAARRDQNAPPIALTQRAIAARVASGRPAAAALDMLDHTTHRLGDLGPEEHAWLRGLGSIDHVGPALTDALAALANSPDATPPAPTATRQIQRMLVRASTDPAATIRRVAASPELARSTAIATDALRSVVPDQRLHMAADVVRQDPAAARAWAGPIIRFSDAPLTRARDLIADRDPARRALGLAMALGLDRPDLCTNAIEAAPGANPAADPFVMAQLAGLAGRWDRVAVWLAAARAGADADPTRRDELFFVLMSCQRVTEATQLANAFADAADPTTDQLLVAAESALLSGEFERALALLERASAIDPFDERVWERRINLRAGETPVSDADATMRLGREISERRPRGDLFAVLRARDLAGAGMLREACETVISINERDPSRETGLQVLAQASVAAIEKGEPETAALVRGWLEDRRAVAPGSVAVTLAIAQIMLAESDTEAVYELVDDAASRIGHPELARNAEGLLAQRLDRADEALARALDRLSGTLGVNDALERGETTLVAQRWSDAINAARAALPPGGELTGPQSARWNNLAFGLIRSAERTQRATEVIQLLDDAARLGQEMPGELVRGQLLLLARTGDTQRLQAFVAEEVLGPDSGLIAVQALLGADRIPEALALLGSIAITDGGVYEDTLAEWARLTGAVGAASDTRSMIERLDAAGHTAEAAASLLEQFSPAPMPGEPSPARHRADIAYTTALVATVLEREDVSESMYRLALEYDPAHAWAANDLGYAIADRDGPLEDADQLLSMAHAVLPGESSTTDSLGWLRYKQGVLEDETDPDGRVTRAGALTLLLQASNMEDGRENPTILEHLGDTMWRLGREEEAIRSWIDAEQFLRRQARELAASDQPNARRADRINTQIRDLRRRLSDVEAGRAPAVAHSPALDPPAPPDAVPAPEPDPKPDPVPFGGGR